jgi:uncharacterized protein YneF (UPF0154 family)
MKKMIFLMLGLFITTAAVMAQSDDNPPPNANAAHMQRPRMSAAERAKEATEKINTAATLSKEQYAKVLDVNTNFFTQRDALRANGGQTDEDRSKMRELAKDRETKLKAILTPEQWQKVMEARKQNQPQHGPGGE